jgi:malonate transporter
VVAPVLGVLWAASGIALPESARSLLHLVGSAASPCALVSLGLFLAVPHRGGSSRRAAAMTLSVLKLVGQPAVTAVFAYGVFRLSPLSAAVAVLVAALPTGTGPFMVAEFYRREAVVTSGTILFSTVASVVTLTMCLLLIGH